MDFTWDHFLAHTMRQESLGITLDTSRFSFPEDYLTTHGPGVAAALAAMEQLEGGSIANPDEGRQVGHYWLRAPELAPAGRRGPIAATLEQIRAFASGVHAGAIRPTGADRFRNVLVIGIGGSALGPQLLAGALGSSGMRLAPFFMDNTDPAGIQSVLGQVEACGLNETLVVVASKSGGTIETWNGMCETEARFRARGLDFPSHAVAITEGRGRLHERVQTHGWRDWFPLWDWVGGRTSVTSAVGILPAALLGLDWEGFLRGAREMDAMTRGRDLRHNPAARLAVAWYDAGAGRGNRDMVILPYSDRLRLLAPYLQQLVMESLGKREDLQGHVVHQGLVVYGARGSTDQHSYLQQLLDGPDNFFLTFVEVLENEGASPLAVQDECTSGDCLAAFLLGTRKALAERGRKTLLLSLDRLDAVSLGAVVALYERAVGLYAQLIGINAYHQPAVEAMKTGATALRTLQQRMLEQMKSVTGPVRAAQLAAALETTDSEGGAEAVYLLLRRLAANPARGIVRIAGVSPDADSFEYRAPQGAGANK